MRVSGSQPTTSVRGSDSAPSVRASASTLTGSIPCASIAVSMLVELGLDHVQGPRWLATGGGVEEHDRGVVLLHRVGEVHATDAEVHDLDAAGQRAHG